MAEHNATPAAVDLAAERGVDLASVQGSGAEGRITKDDVERQAGASAAEEAGHGAGNPQDNTADDQTAEATNDEEVVFVIPNPKRTSVEVVAYLGGERVAVGMNGATLTASQYEEARKLRGEDVECNDVQLLVKRAAS